MSVPDSAQLITMADLLETTVSDLLGAPIENEAEPNQLAKELSRLNAQLAVRNHRTRRALKTVAVVLLALAAAMVVILMLNYAPMPQPN